VKQSFEQRKGWMLNAVGYATKEADRRYKATLRTVSIKADIEILPNIKKTADTQLDFRTMKEADEIDLGNPARARLQ
jgi:uncharacterized protein (DUF736 family)